MHLYVKHLDRHNQHVQEQHASPVPIRCADDFSDMRTIPAVDGMVVEAYVELDRAFSDLPCTDQFVSMTAVQMTVTIGGLGSLTSVCLTPFKEYRYAYGNQLGTVSFAWKISEPENETALAQVLSVVTGQLKVYATRDIKRHFVSRYNHIR